VRIFEVEKGFHRKNTEAEPKKNTILRKKNKRVGTNNDDAIVPFIVYSAEMKQCSVNTHIKLLQKLGYHLGITYNYNLVISFYLFLFFSFFF